MGVKGSIGTLHLRMFDTNPMIRWTWIERWTICLFPSSSLIELMCRWGFGALVLVYTMWFLKLSYHLSILLAFYGEEINTLLYPLHYPSFQNLSLRLRLRLTGSGVIIISIISPFILKPKHISCILAKAFFHRVRYCTGYTNLW
jgi:hypothetical protein